MNIDRHNYEEFFLLYVDNELSPAKRKAVEAFVAENTDLQSELDLIKDAVLQPEPSLSFDFKTSLMKPEGETGLINHENCEEYFLLYADNELDAEHKLMVEKFVYHHPQHQASFELLQQVKLTADTSVIFPDKSSLYRKEKDDKVVPFVLWRLMAAAVVLLAIGIATWYLITNNNNSTSLPPVVAQGKTVTPSPSTKDSEPVNQPADNASIAGTEIVNAPDEAVSGQPSDRPNVTAPAITTPVADQVAKKNKVAPNAKIINPGSNIQLPSTVSPKEENVAINNKNETVVTPKPLEEIVKPDPAQTTASLVSNNPTTEQAGYQEYVEESNSDIVFVANTSVNKKSKLRGVFRKASRFIEKATNLEPGSRGIRVANVEIGLK